jgi:hypothetical protein
MPLLVNCRTLVIWYCEKAGSNHKVSTVSPGQVVPTQIRKYTPRGEAQNGLAFKKFTNTTTMELYVNKRIPLKKSNTFS